VPPLQELTPEQRSQRARIGGYSKSAKYAGDVGTEAARAAGPGQLDYWQKQVDPERTLPIAERQRRAEAAKKAHFTRLALRSAQARSGRKAAS
jgi:hypothetical protein